MARFMYGRNGADQLCWALFIAELVLSLLPALVPGQAFAAFIHYTTLFLCVYLLFRMFSRNLEKRRAENAKFMQWWGPKQSALRGAKARRADKEQTAPVLEGHLARLDGVVEVMVTSHGTQPSVALQCRCDLLFRIGRFRLRLRCSFG